MYNQLSISLIFIHTTAVDQRFPCKTSAHDQPSQLPDKASPNGLHPLYKQFYTLNVASCPLATGTLLEQKESYYQGTFVLPYRDLIVSQTYHRGDFSINEPPLSCDESSVYYKGFLDDGSLTKLKARFPKHSDVFERLFDNYRVISCSATFKYNLELLMRVIINKLGMEAVARFENFYNSSSFNTIPLSEAKKYRNIVVLDKTKGQVIFDLAQVDLLGGRRGSIL